MRGGKSKREFICEILSDGKTRNTTQIMEVLPKRWHSMKAIGKLCKAMPEIEQVGTETVVYEISGARQRNTWRLKQ